MSGDVSIEVKALIERINEVFKELPDLVSTGEDVGFYVSTVLTELVSEAKKRGFDMGISDYLRTLGDANALAGYLASAGAGAINPRAINYWGSVLASTYQQTGDPAAVFSACVDELSRADVLAKSSDDEVALNRQVLIHRVCFKTVVQPLMNAILKWGARRGGGEEPTPIYQRKS